jgi:hypothetical protein
VYTCTPTGCTFKVTNPDGVGVTTVVQGQVPNGSSPSTIIKNL